MLAALVGHRGAPPGAARRRRRAGDEVITTSLTWPATANVILHAGATPVFADVRAGDLNIDPERVAALVGPKTKAILPVHLYGQPADLDPLLALGPAGRRGRGARVRVTLPRPQDRRALGGDLLLALRDEERRRRRRRPPRDERRRGRERRRRPPRDAPRPRLALRHRRSRATRRTSRTCSRRSRSRSSTSSIATAPFARSHFAAYDEALAELDGIDPVARDPRDTHAYHLYVVRIDAERAGATRDEYQRALTEENIGTSIHFLPVHQLTRLPRPARLRQPPLPETERAGREVLSLPLSPAHSDDDIRDADRRAAPRPRAVQLMLRNRWSGRGDGRRHRARRAVHRLEDRRRQDGAHHRLGRSLVAAPLWGADLRHGAAQAWRWQLLLARARDSRAARLATRALLRLLRRRPGAADGASAATRRGSTRRPGVIPATARRSPVRCCSSARSAVRSRSCSRRSASCSRSGATTSAPTSGSRRSSSSSP